MARRRLLPLFVGLLVVTLGTVAAQQPPKEEQVEPVPPKVKAPPKVDDDVKPPAAKEKDKNKGKERTTTALDVRQLFPELAIEHDRVTLSNGGKLDVEPIPQFIGEANPTFAGKIVLRKLRGTGSGSSEASVTRSDVAGVIPYERLALITIDEFLKKTPRDGTTPEQLRARLEALQQSDRALETVLQFHGRAVETKQRDGSQGWTDLGLALNNRLRAIRIDRLRTLAGMKDWKEAQEFAARLRSTYPTNAEVRTEVVSILARHAEEALQERQWKAARQRLDLILSQYPDSTVAQEIRDKLRKAAQAVFEEARALKKQNLPDQAMARLRNAEEIWPELPGLRDEILKQGDAYPILRVGVRELPRDLSPLVARLDVDKQACELLFEALVEQVMVGDQGLVYQPELAVSLPRTVPRGRIFEVQNQARWSDGRLVKASDVIATWLLLREPSTRSFVYQWRDLVDQAEVPDDPYQIHFSMSQGFLDPLSLLTFKVLPQLPDGQRPDSAAFAKQPIGSGPFMLKGLEKVQGRDEMVFVANPYYGDRPGRSGLPRIREIRFFRMRDLREEARNEQMQLWLDVPSGQVEELKKAELEVVTHRNRRIWFLAVNNQQPLLKDVETRRALAHAIDREKILDQCFREGTKHHRPLNGPFPPGSWADNPQVQPRDPFKPDLARALAVKLIEQKTKPRLKLKYPDNDPRVAEACNLIKEQINQHAGVEIELLPCAPRTLIEDVIDKQDYELAYFSHDYPTEAFWLWPLFDPRGMEPGGGNYLRYSNDGPLESAFQKAMGHRQITAVQALMHNIHQQIHDKMPLIPLWQLDTHHALRKTLQVKHLDPLQVFTQAEQWELKGKGR